MKLIAPKREEAPAKCKENIPISTAGLEWAAMPLRGGYIVHPVPTPPSTKVEVAKRIRDGTNNQKLALFNLGNAISGAPIMSGTNQLPKPPISTGITKKKIISSPWAVITTL